MTDKKVPKPSQPRPITEHVIKDGNFEGARSFTTNNIASRIGKPRPGGGDKK